MTKAKKATDKLKALRKWAAQFGLRLRRRGTGYSLYGNPMKLGKGRRRVDFRKLSQIARWLDEWAEDQFLS